MSTRVRVDARKLDAIIRKLPDAGRSGAGEAARALRDLIKATAPVRTGRMRDSTEAENEGGTWVVRVKVPYAGYVNYGTRFMAAQPFFTASVETARKEFKDRVAVEVRKDIESA